MLNAKAFALSAGILWGLVIFVTTLMSTTTGFGRALLETYGSVHPGYSISIAGAFVGLVYSFVCAAIGAYIFAWLYNRFEEKFK